jgi:hypothetical protein
LLSPLDFITYLEEFCENEDHSEEEEVKNGPGDIGLLDLAEAEVRYSNGLCSYKPISPIFV